MSTTRSLRTLQLVYGLALTILIVVAGAAGIVGLVLAERWSGEARRVERLAQLAQVVRGDVYRQAKEVFDFHFLADPQASAQYSSYAGRIDASFAELAGLAEGAGEQAAIAELAAAYAGARAQADAIMARPSGGFSEAEKLDLFDTDYEAGSLARVEAALDHAEDAFLGARAAVERRLKGLTRLAVAVVLVPIAAAAGLLLVARAFVQRAFVAPLAEVLRATAAFGAGDFAGRLDERGAAEMVALGRAINRMADDVARSRAELVRAEKQAALGALVPVIAHNIRNPLASIRASAQVLDTGAADAETRDGLRGIIAAVDRLSGWLTALLSYLNPQPLHRRDGTLAACADEALALLGPRLEAKRLEVARRGWDAGATVRLDRHLVEQAIYGLLANAVEASPDGGRLTVAAGAADGASWLSIEDHGPGLAFAPRQDAFPGPSTKALGSGLGIPFAFKVCELHDGALKFAPAAGGGTAVTLSLPIAGDGPRKAA
ncbi:MAG TPA: ATP-binding protein [Alphaproteobacteria bacterium]